MGARTVFTFETEPGEAIHLYSHSGGEDKINDLANAIDKARVRWSDETYALRIMISTLIGESWNSEYGYGLWTQHRFEESYETTEINIRDKMVYVNTAPFTFDEFISEFGGSK
jgi:hypothetical protein